MTNKFLLNLLGFNPDLTSRQPRVDSLSLVSRQSDLLTHLGRITAILVLVLTIGVGNAWGAGTTVTYTLTAKTTVSKSGTAPTGATATVTSTGSWYTSGSDGRKNTDQMTAGKNTVLTLSGFKGYKITGIVLNMCSNSSNGKGTFSAVAGSTTIASISSATNFNTWYDNTSYGTSRRNVNVSLTNSTYEIKQDEDVVITIACVTTNSLYISSWSITYEAVGGCSNSVAVTKGSESHGSVTTIATSPVATCSATASDRRVTVTITPDECYDAPTNLTWTKSSGTVTASKQSGPTDNGDGTYSYVYQFAQNDNGAGTFGVTCTAKAAGKTVNFNAGPGSCGTSSLTETCDGSGVVLPNVTASGVCKGWTTFAGWRTSAIATADSTTTNPGTLYAAGSTYYPSSDNETLYAVFSKTKGGGTTPTKKTLTFGTSYASNGSDLTSVTIYTGITATATEGTNNYPKFYTSSPGTWRMYSGSELTISSSIGNITKIEFTKSSDFSLSVKSGESGTLSSETWTYASGVSSVTFNVGGTTKLSAIAVTYLAPSSTTYYCSDPNCCTPLGTINGSVSLSNPTTAVLTWDNISNVSSWAVACRVHEGSAAGTIGSITTNGAGKKTCTITGLTCNTNYDFTISATANSGYCDKSETLENKNSGKWNVTHTLSNVTKSSGQDPGNNVLCGDYNATFTASTGFNLPTSITVTGASSYTWNQETGVLSILSANITDNIVVTITGEAQSNFPNNKTIFIQANSSSAWDANACVVAWFHSYGGSETAQSTYWLFDATDGDAGKKLFAAVVPASGDLPYLDINRYASDCSTPWNKNGGVSFSDASGSNTVRSEGSGNDQVYWNASGVTLSLYGDPNSWASSLGTFADQGAGVWTATYSNYAPANAAGETQNFKISTNYNGWIGNTGSNNNATLDGMHVGSTYNITATLDIKDHSLVMSKTFVKGTVHFDLQGHGSAIADLTNVAAGSKISAPSPAPNETGWDFGGWYKEAGCTNAWNFASDEVTETMTLYAKWTKKSYTITSTLNNVTSSPAIPTSYEYTGSAAGLSYTISADAGYRLPTSITVSGTTYTWNSATGALTLTGTITSNVSITITAVQTHTVDWYVGGSAPANKIGDDGQTTVVDHGGKIEDFPATTPDGSACDKTFVGWTNTSSYVHGTSPLFNDVAGSPTINADANFYAVFATGGGDDFELVTAVSQLHVGDVVTIANFVGNSESGAVIKAYNSGNNWPEASASTDASGKISGSTTDMQTFTLEEGSVDDTWAFNDGTGYPYAASSGSNHMKRETTLSGNSSFAITIDGSTSVATIVAQGDYTRNVMQYNSSSNLFACYGSASQASVYLYKKPSYTGHTITCSDCGTSVTPTYTAAPAGGTVSVTKSAAAVASGSTVKTCTSVDLTVTITPASHYTLTGFTATGLSTGTATISPAVGSTLPKTTETTFTVTVSSGATGTLNLTPTFTEDAHVAINWNVNGVNQSIAATEGLTWVYSGGDLTALPSEPSVPAGCSGTKVFAGWSAKHSDATEEDAAYYDDLFTTVGGAPTGISSAKTFYAVFATSSANPLAGEVMWAEDWDGASNGSTPSGTTGYSSTSISYAYTNGGSDTKVYAGDDQHYAGGSSPELLIGKSTGVFDVTNIPTAGQTELTLTYKANKAFGVSSGTSGVTVGDANVDGTTYTRTITISQSPAVNNFALSFTNTNSGNGRLDDISLVVPGSGTMSDYVTTCAPSYTITYNKNTEDAVTNLPSPTSVLQSTGSGTLSSTVPERATYTFSGWSETTSGAVAYAAGGSITGVTGDKALYAVWTKTPVEELFLNYSELNKYVGDPAVTLEVTGVTPEGADPSVTWSSSNSSVASVVAATGVVTFGTVGTATITATSTVTGTTTAYCYVTVRNKPTASFTDLIHDGNGTDLSTYHMQNVAGTEIVFPTLDDYATPGDDCDSKHYIFVGWTTSDNNDDPEDHLVASGELEDDQDKVFYAVWADGVEGVSYTQLTTSTFKTSPTKYVIGAIDGDDTFYFYSCAATDANNGNGGCTNAPGTNAPIQFTLSGTADALVATSTEATARYLTPLTAKNFQMSETSKTIQLNDDGTIANPSDESWTLRFNTSEDYLRWYSSATGNAAYFYEVTAGAAVSYRTSCCTNNVPAPTVVATNTAYTVTLTWAAVDGATGYEVSWNGGAFTAATSPCVKSDLTASTDYTYKVRATYNDALYCGALVASGSVTTDDVYSVTYSGGTGTGSCSPSGSVAPASYEAGATVTLAPTNSYSMTSNTFAAWVVKDADDNDVPVSNNQFTMPAKNVTVTATWTAVQDKYYDRMHDGTDGSHGGVQDGEGKYYLVREGCNYTVPTLTDDDDGDTDCHTTHYKLLGWIAQSHLKTDGSGEIKPGEESHIFQGGGTKSATGATYYAIWAIMTE